MAMLQLRTIPEDLKRALRRRARQEGVSMSDYVLRLIRDDLARPTPQEIKNRLDALADLSDGPSGAELLEEARREAGRT